MEDIRKLVEDCDLKHIAIIMDGNRRWAKERSLPSAVGHKKGVDALKKTMRACDDYGIKYLTVYAFSTENWNRKPEEVNFLMDLLGQTLKNELKEMDENNVVISFIGDTTKLSEKLQGILKNAVETTKNNTGVNLQIAFNYGARDELIHAVQAIVDEGIEKISEITGYPVKPSIGYPTPGSFGTWAGLEKKIPGITLELDEENEVEKLEKPIFEVFEYLENL